MILVDTGFLVATLDPRDGLHGRARAIDGQLEARERGRTYHMSSPEELKQRNEAFKVEQEKNPNAVGIKAE